MPPVQHIAASSAGWTASGVGAAYTITIDTPAAARAGDTVIALLVLTDAAAIEIDDDSEWTTDFVHDGAADNIIAARYVIADDEGTTLPPIALSDEPTAAYVATLVKRGLPAGVAVYGASQATVAASTDYPCPSQSLVAYSGLYVGLVVSSVDGTAVVPPAGTTERLDFDGGARRIAVFDLLPEAAGDTGVRTATTASGNGHAVSLAYAADHLIGGKSLAKLAAVSGMLGLPTRGV